MKKLRIRPRFVFMVLLVISAWGVLFGGALQAQQGVDVQIDRWLRVESVTGEVQYFNLENIRPAQVGDLLTTIGDGIRTGQNASSTLAIDDGIGTITLQADTEIQVRDLLYASDNGHITHLFVPYGNVILKLRRFTHPGSEVEIETPSGVSGVRGTEFGVVVHADDLRTGVATLTGEVYALAQSQTVIVPAGYQTLIRPGSPPTEPTRIPPEPILDFRVEQVILRDYRQWVLIGQVDPINQVYIADELQSLNELGEFRYEVPAYQGATVQVRVVTPLGEEGVYEVPLL